MSWGVLKQEGQPSHINAAHCCSVEPQNPDINPEGNVALPVANEIWSF